MVLSLAVAQTTHQPDYRLHMTSRQENLSSEALMEVLSEQAQTLSDMCIILCVDEHLKIRLSDHTGQSVRAELDTEQPDLLVTLVSEQWWFLLYDCCFNPLTSVKWPVLADAGNPWIHSSFSCILGANFGLRKSYSLPLPHLEPLSHLCLCSCLHGCEIKRIKFRSKSIYSPVLLKEWETFFKEHWYTQKKNYNLESAQKEFLLSAFITVMKNWKLFTAEKNNFNRCPDYFHSLALFNHFLIITFCSCLKWNCFQRKHWEHRIVIMKHSNYPTIYFLS